MKIDDIKLLAGNAKFALKKNSPEILIGVGVAGVVATVIMACKATLKVEDTLDCVQADIEEVKTAEYKDEKSYKYAVTSEYIKGGMKVIRLYAPAFVVGTASLYSILYSHNIMKKRNVAAIAAYELLSDGFESYRQRVRDELGEEADRRFRYGIEEREIEHIYVDDKGKEHKKKEKGEVIRHEGCSIYARFFDEGCMNWSKSPEHNLYFVKLMQSQANDTLNSRGHIFLNEVYDMLGIPRTEAGQMVGWMSTKNGGKDGYVDFGIFNIHREANRDFVNGYEPVILLDFNVDGVISNRI